MNSILAPPPDVRWNSPCKINLLLNILGKRPDGFHELETVMVPIPVHDELTIRLLPATHGLQVTCSDPVLPVDQSNLVTRAASRFLAAAHISTGLHIHLEKRLPMGAGLGGGSANAAVTLRALNHLLNQPLSQPAIQGLAAELGSDVPFFLQDQPALATGRGETVQSLPAFPALKGLTILLVHPGFGIPTPWAYKELARFPLALNGSPGRARHLIEGLQSGTAPSNLQSLLYNSLEAPALTKYPVLALYQQFFRSNQAAATLMSGSGSTTFALFPSQTLAAAALHGFTRQFGNPAWSALATL